MAEVKILHRAMAALIALLLCIPAFAQDGAGARHARGNRQYREVAFTGQFLHRDDRRFRIAAAGFTFRSGVMLQSRDPALHMVRWFDGSTSSGRLSNGRVIVLWPSMFAQPLVREARVARTAELAEAEISWARPNRPAATHPAIPGYRYVTSASLVGTANFLGLWHREGRPAETLIVSFRASGTAPYLRVGTVPLRLNSLIISSPMHNISWSVTFTSDAPAGRPLYILHYDWMPGYFQPLASLDAAAAR